MDERKKHGRLDTHADVSSFSELALARRAAAGDAAAFAAIVHTYEARLLAYLMQMLGDPDAARDVAQDTFLAVYQALPRWQPPEHASTTTQPLSPWLYRIATNRALSLLRARPIASTGEFPALGEAPEPGSMSFEERFAARELLQAALRQLSAEDAACLVLHFVAGERYGEIARRLDLTSEAVRKRIGRGLATLRAAYVALDSEVSV